MQMKNNFTDEDQIICYQTKNFKNEEKSIALDVHIALYQNCVMVNNKFFRVLKPMME